MRGTCVLPVWQEKLCNIYKSSEAGIESWTNTIKTTQGNGIQSKSMAEAAHRYEHRTESKSQKWFEEDFFKLMNNYVFGKTMKNVREQRSIKLVAIDIRNHLVSGLNYHTAKYFSEKLLTIEINKTDIKIKKPVYEGLSFLNMSKIAMY